MENIIVGIGEILWDVFPRGKVLGGAPANFVYHASQFGLDGYAVSAIGSDSFGDEILENLNNKELKYLIQRMKDPTGTVRVKVDENGIPQYEILEDVAWDNIPFTSEMEELARKTKTVFFGTLAQRHKTSRKTINQFLDAMPADSLKIFDINLRQHFYSKELIDHSLLQSNVLKINDDELIIVAELFGWKIESEIKICQQILEDYQLNLVILTKGTKGSYVITKSETYFKPTPSIVVVDTVGAGDSFTAAFVASLLRGQSISEAHQLAVDVSSFVCTQRGAMPLLPDSLLNRVPQ